MMEMSIMVMDALQTAARLKHSSSALELPQFVNKRSSRSSLPPCSMGKRICRVRPTRSGCASPSTSR